MTSNQPVQRPGTMAEQKELVRSLCGRKITRVDAHYEPWLGGIVLFLDDGRSIEMYPDDGGQLSIIRLPEPSQTND